MGFIKRLAEAQPRKSGVYFELDGYDELVSKLTKIESEFKSTKIQQALRKIVKPLVAEAKRQAPILSATEKDNLASAKYDKGLSAAAIARAKAFYGAKGIKIGVRHKGTAPKAIRGQLKFSIGTYLPKRKLRNVVSRVYVGPAFGRNARNGKDGWYGHFLEFGTSRGIDPNPYMLRAFLLHKATIAQKIVSEIDGILQSYKNARK